MKQCLYAHRLEEGASIHEHLTIFKEILSNLEAVEVQYDKEDLGLILLCSLPPSYLTFRDTILYSRESLTIDEVYDSLTSYDKIKHLVVKPDYQGESLIAQNFGGADVVEDYNDGELLVPSVNDSKVSKEWILDSGCTFHMSLSRDWFTTYEIVSEGVVLIRNNASCKIAGVGTIKVKMFDGVVRTLSDVRHVLELKRNLISLSTLDSKGYRYIAESGVLKISKGSIVMMKGQRKTAKLYVLQGSTVTRDVAVASSSLSDDDITKLWHMRLGHMSENGMGSIITRDAAVTSSSLSDDDITKLWHMRLGHMSENGMVELSKRGLLDGTIMEKVRYMLSNANLPKSFWAEAASTACFLINRSPSVTSEKNTPQEVWSGNPANYSDLKIFGCPAYAHVDNEKLEPRSIKCVFLGYKAGVKGYKLWCPENSKVVISRDYAEADLVAYALNVAEDIDANQEPSNYSKAISYEDSEKWMFAMQEEMESLHKNKTWDLVKLSKGVDFTDVFSPVVKHGSIRALLGIVAMHDLELEQLDVKTAFLNGELEENIYMQQPEGFTVSEKEDYVCLLKKSLLRFETVTKAVVQEKKSDGSFVYLLLYVDDMLIAAKDKGEIRNVKTQLSKEFEMKDLGPAKKILGMEILRDRKASKLYLSQKGYIEKVLCRFNMQSAKPVSTPLAAHFRLSSALSPQSDDEIEYMSHVPYSSAVGSLIYAMVCSRPDLSYAVSAVSRYMANPDKKIGKQFNGF
ncbi:hypothetical protein CXB51_016759 [Gossypium anomalum]|uniref:Reverse transcriptase Ty1/copia-type domain-containing protein n=1 Tax=Gossypium anomalum TaxID=47600 RepID=A0A8J5YTT8_9ROSI|nr:hypothetical protein CXB51_016759 [Gossypium anomalum]